MIKRVIINTDLKRARMVKSSNKDYYEKHLGAILLKLSKFNRLAPLQFKRSGFYLDKLGGTADIIVIRPF